MKNMKIRAKMLLSYLIIVVLMLISGIVSVIMLNKVSNSLQTFYVNEFQTTNMSWSARRNSFATRGSVLQAIIDTDSSVTTSSINDAKSTFQAMKDNIQTLKSSFTGDMTQLTNCETLLTQAEPYLNQISELVLANQDDEAYKILMESYKPLMDEFRATMINVAESVDLEAAEKVEEGRNLDVFACILVIAMISVSILISIALALTISGSIRRPVAEMKEVCAKIAKGDLNVKIEYDSRDELGEMAGDLRLMTDSLKTIIEDIDYCVERMADGDFTVKSRAEKAYVGNYASIINALRKLRTGLNDILLQIDVSADQVNSGGEQVSSSAQALAQGSTEQASSVQELAATINDISNRIEATAEHAKTAKDENEQTHQQIEICSSHMDELMQAMNVIDNKSKEISKVIKTIEDIAFQTNILALNAAVEAARAGSAGKGFAVVADEVRNLATKSQEASKSTGALIEETVKAVADGSRLSGSTNESLREVVTRTQKVLDAVTLISNATEEESEALTQVTTGIDQISSVVQTNSATAEQSAAASEELSGQANLLKEMIGRFTLSHSDATGKSVMGSAPSSNDEFAPAGGYDTASHFGDKY